MTNQIAGLYLVGAPGVGTRGTASPVTGLYSQPPKASNLLVAVINWGSTTTAVATVAQNTGTTGWTLVQTTGNGGASASTCGTSIWTKTAAGGDAAPAFTVTGSGTLAAQCTIFELFNPAGTPVDVITGLANGTGSQTFASANLSLATSSNISGPGEFVIRSFSSQINGAAATSTWTAGTGFTNAYNDGATSSVMHFAVDYAPIYPAVVASGSAATDAPTISGFTGWTANIIVAFKPAVGTNYPNGVISAVGSLISNTGNGPANLPISPRFTGDLLVLATTLSSSTITLSSIADTNGITTGWIRVAGVFVDNNATTIRSHEIWIGKATGTGATQLNLSWSSSSSGLLTDLDCQEFTNGYAVTTWARDGTQQASQNNAASVTVNWTSLTAAGSGELFVGHARVPAGNPWQDTNTNYVSSLDANKNCFLYNASAGSGTVTPFVTDLAGSIVSYTIGVLITSAYTVIPYPPVIEAPWLAGSIFNTETFPLPEPSRIIGIQIPAVNASVILGGGAGTVTFDAVGPSAAGSATSPWAHANSAAGNAIVAGFNYGTGNSSGVTAVSYGGVALARIGQVASDNQTSGGVDLWGKIGGLPTGSNNVTVTGYTGTQAGSVSLAGVTSFGTPVTAFGAASPASAAVPLTTSGGQVVSVFCFGSIATLAATSPNVMRWSKSVDSGSGSDNGGMGTDPSTGGTVTPAFTASVSDWWGVVAVEARPSAGTGATLATSASFPAVTVTIGAAIAPAVLACTASFPAPAIRADEIVTPAVLATTTAFPARTVNAGEVVTPATLAGTVTLGTPAVSTGSVVTTTVLATSASFSAPTINAGEVVTPAVLATSASFPAPTVNAGSSVTTTVLATTTAFAAPAVDAVTPGLLAASASFPAPAVDVITPAVLATSASFPAPTVTVASGVNITPAVLSGSVSFSAPTVNAGSVVTPAVLATSASFPAPVVNAGSVVTTAVLAVSAAFSAPVVNAGSVVTTTLLAGTAAFSAPAVDAITPALLATSASFSAPAVDAITPAALATSASFAAPAISAGSVVAPPVLSGSVSFSAPVVNAGEVVTPGVLATSASFPALTVNAGSGITTTALAVSASFPAPAIRADANLVTTVLAGTVSFPARTVNAGSVTTPAALATSASFAAPAVDSVTPATLAGTVSFGAPVVDSIRPAALATSASFPAPTVNAGSGVTTSVLATSTSFSAPAVDSVKPALLSGSVSFGAPAVDSVVPVSLSGTVSFPAPAFECDEIVSPAVLATAATFTPPTVTAGGNVNVILPPWTLTVSFPAPAIQISEPLTTTVLAGPVSFSAPSVSAGSGVTTTLLHGTVSFPAPALRTDEKVTPAALATSASFPAPTVTTASNATVTPTTLAGTVSFSAPALRCDQKLTPASLAVSASFAAPQVGAGAGVTPASLACLASFAAPVVQVNATAHPATLATAASFPPPVVSISINVALSTFAVAAVFPPVTFSASAAVTPAPFVTAVSFSVPSIVHALPVFGAIGMTATGSMVIVAAAGADVTAAWEAYAAALSRVQVLSQDLVEAVIAGGRSGVTGSAYAATYSADQEAELAYEAWQAALRHWQRENSIFAAYGSAAAT